MFQKILCLFTCAIFGAIHAQTPVPNFSSVPAAVGGTITICQGATISFTNTSNQTVAGTTYSWNFGTGASPATANTIGPHTVTYNTATATTVTLTVNNNNGTGPQQITRNIVVNPNPNAALTLVSSGGGYGTVTQGGQTIFKNCGSIDSALFTFNAAVNNTVTQTFNWGDGSSSTNAAMVGTQISHDYPQGQFTLIHTVTQNGCTSTASYIVFNGSSPQITVSAIGSNTCLPSPYAIDILSNNVPITYTITFSDGTPNVIFTTVNDTTINHIFNTSSCGVDYVIAPGLPPIPNAYSAAVVAQNFCSNNGIPTVVTVGPIVISTGTTADFSYNPPSPICVLEPVMFNNETVAGESINQNGCDTTYGYYWTITPNTYTLNSGSLGSSNGFTGATYDYTQWTNGSYDMEVLFSQPGTYYVTLYTGNFCGLDSIMDSVIIKPEAHLTFSSNQQTICSGDSSALFTMTADQPNYIINWDITDTTNISNITVLSGSGTTPVTFNALVPQNNTDEVGTIEITATVECSSDSADVHTITVNPQANASVDPLFYQICNGETTDIDITSNIDNVGFSWTAAAPGTITGYSNGTGNNIAQTLNNSGTTMDTVQYVISVLNAQCPGDTAIVSVAVQPELTINTNLDFTVCPNAAINPDDYISSPPNATISWTNSNTNIGLGASGNGDVPSFNAANNTTGNTISGTIEVTLQLNDCPAVTDQFIVNVNSAPGFDYTTTPDNGLDCITGVGTINGQVTPLNTTASWSGPGIVSGGNTFSPVINQPGQYSVVLTDNGNGCVSNYIVTIEPPTLINITAVSYTNVTCFGGANGTISITTDNGSGANINYDWTPDLPNSANVSGLSEGGYSVQVTNEDGCVDDTSVVLSQPTEITIAQIDSTGSECGEANGSLSVMASGGTGVFTYSWSSGNTGPTAANIDEGMYTVNVTDAAGCTLSGMFDLGCTPLIPIVIPQFISPNGDNANELWFFQNTAQYPDIHVKVFNRWGNEVYEARPYNNDWNGHLKGTNPNPLPAGTYFYIVDTNKKSQDPVQGYIEIQP